MVIEFKDKVIEICTDELDYDIKNLCSMIIFKTNFSQPISGQDS